MAKLIVTTTFTVERTEEIDPEDNSLATIRDAAEQTARETAAPQGGKLQRWQWRIEEGDEVLAAGSKYLNE